MLDRFGPVSNAETWSDRIYLTDIESGEPVNLTLDVTSITLKLRDPRDNWTMMTASTADDTIIVVDDGILEFTFTPGQMGALDPKTYEFGGLIEMVGETVQFALGRVTVIGGF